MEMENFGELLEKLGWMGIPLLLTSVAAVAIGVERWVFFHRHRPKREAVVRWMTGCGEGETELKASPLWGLVRVYREGEGLPEEKRCRHCETVIMGWIHRARGPIQYLSVLAQVAPLLGLTGTVLGLVEAFRVIEKNERMASPSLLAGGIWEALLTTIAGMLIAIPLILVIRAFNGRIEETAMAARELYMELEKGPGTVREEEGGAT
jgi:biopolymer transport protein ExbB